MESSPDEAQAWELHGVVAVEVAAPQVGEHLSRRLVGLGGPPRTMRSRYIPPE